MAGHQKKKTKDLVIKQVSREPFITFPYSNKRKWGLAFGTIVRIKGEKTLILSNLMSALDMAKILHENS